MESPDMAPAVQPGDVLEFEEARLMDLRRGDLVLVHAQGACRLRRIHARALAEGGEVFTLVADALPEPPKRHGFEEILARVVRLERDGETLRPRGDSVRKARFRRRLREMLKDAWLTLHLRFGR